MMTSLGNHLKQCNGPHREPYNDNRPVVETTTALFWDGTKYEHHGLTNKRWVKGRHDRMFEERA